MPNEENSNFSDTFFLSRNSNYSNLGDSNFFSTYGDKSMMLKQLNEMDKQIEDDNKSNFTIELDLERQVDSLIYEEDDLKDLNDGRFFENDKSNCSFSSNLLNSNQYNNNNQHNMTTPMPLLNHIFTQRQTIESEDKLNNNNNILTPANSIIDINKKILGEKNKDDKKEKEFNISTLGDKCTDTLTFDSNNNITGNLITNWNPGGNILGNKPESNISSFDFHSNSVDLKNNMNLIRGLYYNQTPNNSIYYNSKYYKNNKRYNKFQQNYSQSLYTTLNKNDINNQINNFNNINTINFSELSSRTSIQSLNKNRNYNNYYKSKFNYCNNHNIKIKTKDEANKSINESWRIMLKDQKGSKYIQKKIEEKSPEFLNKLYEKIKNNLQEIMTDQYGNYVIQKFVEYCDKKIISKMFSQISNTLYEISINNYGTRPVQKMIENLSLNMTTQDINIILGMTKGNVLELIKDINGNRVIQSIIQNFKNKELLSPLYKELNDNITEILRTKSGCCVFSKVILNITENDLNLIVDNIIKNFSEFINDEYGNISLKRLIKLNNENYNSKIFPCIKDSIIPLSCQKFSSNVIEACIDNNTSLKKNTIEKLIENDITISKLITDQFGNYIIQKALQNSEQKDFDIIINIIKNNEKKIKQSQHGRIIFEKLVKSYKKYLIDDKSEKDEGKINNKNGKNKKHNNGNKNKNKGNKKK